MIDNTYEITDIKAELKSYSVYGYASDAVFITDLTKFCSEVVREKMLNVMGSSTYANLQAQGKTGLESASDFTLINAYWAEVYYTVSFFYKFRDRMDKAARIGYTESNTSATGESKMISGYSGKQAAAFEYMQRADNCMQRAGFNTQAKLTARGSIHA